MTMVVEGSSSCGAVRVVVVSVWWLVGAWHVKKPVRGGGRVSEQHGGRSSRYECHAMSALSPIYCHSKFYAGSAM